MSNSALPATATGVRLGLLVLGISAAFSAPASGQPTVRVSRDRPCAGCGILAETRVVLGDRTGEGELGEAPWLACRRGGPYVAATLTRPGELLLFDETGAFTRSIGRRGSGPGEFRVVYPVRFGPGDSLYVFDPSNRRLTVMSPALEIIRMTRLPASPFTAAPLADGSVVIGARIGDAARIGLPLHLVDVEGAIRLSFGAEHAISRPDMEYVDRRRISGSAPGDLWSAWLTSYRIEQWSIGGELRKSLEVPTDWFPSWSVRPPDGPPPPMIIDVQEDRAGLLWVMITRADPRYRPDPAGERRMIGRPASSDQSSMLDTVIEVIDPRAATVLASRSFDQDFRGFACEHQAFHYEEDAGGVPRIRVWSLSVSHPSLRRQP